MVSINIHEQILTWVILTYVTSKHDVSHFRYSNIISSPSQSQDVISFFGIIILTAAATMVEVGRDKKNPDEFAMALDETLGDFAFPDEFVFDVWGAIGDAKQGRF